jgi:hypothetical protein
MQIKPVQPKFILEHLLENGLCSPPQPSFIQAIIEVILACSKKQTR